jgi:indole-3-glycerol phosphate synthase
MILERILEAKRERLSHLRRLVPLCDLERAVNEMPPTRDFAGALRGPLSIIAEIKRRSPSKGTIRGDMDPLEVALVYSRNGASAISVLTDEDFFGGHPSHLSVVREAVPLPLLRKDFIVDPYQVYESRALGADALLLIAGVLPDESLGELMALARDLGLCALVEVHTRNELDRALAAGATIIGVNNRDLRTFSTDLRTTLEIAPHVPPGRVVVSESGIRSRQDIEILLRAGVRCCLVGEALMAAKDIGAKLRELLGGG